MIATAPFAPSRPTSLGWQADVVTAWATIFVLLLAFWSGIGVGAAALWGQLAG